ncbi:MAG TPA: DUF1778 domain-containing protein [Roseiarcus sp.]|nr:DUF1778 domain-containing protein [Roseiarcus sp.]
MARSATARNENINLRIAAQTKKLIDTAASTAGQTRTEFMVEAARTKAIDVLLDQRFFFLSGKDATSFLSALDNPPKANERLKKLLKTHAPWEK